MYTPIFSQHQLKINVPEEEFDLGRSIALKLLANQPKKSHFGTSSGVLQYAE